MGILQVENVSKEFPTRSEPLVVLREVNLQLEPGRSVAVLGPSGSGKSTLLNIIGTLEPPSGGRVLFDGVDPFELNEPALADFRNRRIGFVFQEHHLLPQCSVLENVLLPTLTAGRTSNEQIERAKMLLQRVGINDRKEHLPGELSGGERQRTALARALINRPDIILADEPTGNLDRKTSQEVGRLLLEMQQAENTILIIVTHSERLADIMERRFELDEGRLRET
jgi:lipoprotein-releasing system ATP-binding protein